MKAARSVRAALAMLGCALVGWFVLRAVAGEPSELLGQTWHREQRVVDRNARPLRTLPSAAGLRGAPIALEAMGHRLVSATLVSEDRRFHEHSGVDYRAVLRALGQNVSEGRLVSGASTITQQLVKLLDGEGHALPRTWPRKLVETARAQNLEQQLSKSEILRAYINRLSYGRGLVGPERAARALLGKAPADLSWAEAAFLAVLPRAPSALDPYRHPERVQRRQRALLEALHEHGLIDQADLARALGARIELEPIEHPFEAEHWVDRQLASERAAPVGTTITTLDLELQRDAEGIVRSHRTRLTRAGADNVAAMVVDNRSGEVLAYVGSYDYGDAKAGQVDHVRALRQPGSTLKPFVYALAFSKGLNPNEPVADVPTRFGEAGLDYAPENFDQVFHGPVSARTALASSLNVPAVRLTAELSEGSLLALLRSAGITSLKQPSGHYGLALALGSGEVTLDELVAAYAMLARQGQRLTLKEVVASADELGQAAPGERVIDAESAALVTDSLSDPLARVLGLGSARAFDLGFPVAVKTGTSSGYRDAWTVGYTRELSIGVWVGNSGGAPTQKLTGASGAGPVFADLMRRAMRDIRARAPLIDEGLLEEVDVCPLSGLPRGPACPHAAKRKLAKSRLPHLAEHEPCAMHRHAKGNTCTSDGPQRIVVLPEVYREWLAAQPPGAPGRDPQGWPWLASSETLGCTEGERAKIAIVEPAAGSVFLANQGRTTLEARASVSGSTTPELEFLLDGELLARTKPPYRVAIQLEPGDHELVARAPGVEPSRTTFSVR